MNAIYMLIVKGKHGGPLISEVINITMEGWTLANNFHAQDENTCDVTYFLRTFRKKSGKMVSLNSHPIIGFSKGSKPTTIGWEGLTPEGQETLRFGHEGAKVSGVCVGELLGAGVGDEEKSQLVMLRVFDFWFVWDRISE